MKGKKKAIMEELKRRTEMKETWKENYRNERREKNKGKDRRKYL